MKKKVLIPIIVASAFIASTVAVFAANRHWTDPGYPTNAQGAYKWVSCEESSYTKGWVTVSVEDIKDASGKVVNKKFTCKNPQTGQVMVF